ncbi:MAG TPA: glycosyl hydrolase [Syntrophomonadaceae bacterium]|nr:glycosyl hydrolase [Syntrophomonadaceae bacterium]
MFKRIHFIIVLCLCIMLITNDCSLWQEYNTDSKIASAMTVTPVPEWMKYTNTIDGYQVEVPGAWVLDSSKTGTVTRLSASDRMAIIDIFAQPLKNITANEYLNYSNQHIIKQEQGLKVIEQNWEPITNLQTYHITWQRPKIANRSNDLNLYREIDLILPGTVYTFILKTDAEHLDQYRPVMDHIIQSFKPQPPEQLVENKPLPVVLKDIRLAGEKMSLKIPGNQMMFGIFNQTFFLPGGSGPFEKYEESLGYKFEFIMTYIKFWQEFPQEVVDRAYSEGRVMMLTWHPVMQTDLNSNSVIIPNIINGDYDPYIKDFAGRMKSIGAPVFLRFGNEMNGDWDPWCAWFYSKDADLYLDAWQHIYQIIKQEGASNVYFVWNPNDRTYPNFKWNSPELYYPGSEYVDWVGLTSYNDGTSYPDGIWRNFNDMYRPVYNHYLLKYPGKPFMVTEFSCNEAGGDKEAWIKECLSSLKSYPNIRIAVWFDKTEGKWLYRIDSTPGSEGAFKDGIKDPYYLRNAITR